MKIVVCLKQVPDTTVVKIDPKTGTLIRDGVPSIINPEDKHALEAALQLKENHGAHVTVISMGPPQAKNALREASLLLAEKSDTSLMWLRAYYILGDDSNNNSIFSKITQMEHEGKESFPFVSGKNKYDFINVDELAKQIATASTQSDITGIINCCSGKPVSLADKVNEFIEKNHYSIRPDYGKFPERPYDSPAIWGDNTKINKIMESNK